MIQSDQADQIDNHFTFFLFYPLHICLSTIYVLQDTTVMYPWIYYFLCYLAFFQQGSPLNRGRDSLNVVPQVGFQQVSSIFLFFNILYKKLMTNFQFIVILCAFQSQTIFFCLISPILQSFPQTMTQQSFQYFYKQSFVRMRHQCALLTKNSITSKQQFKRVFCLNWQTIMNEKKLQFKTSQQLDLFHKLFYHPGDFAYYMLKLDALKILKEKPLNQIKKSVWKDIFETKMPKIYENLEKGVLKPKPVQEKPKPKNGCSSKFFMH